MYKKNCEKVSIGRQLDTCLFLYKYLTHIRSYSFAFAMFGLAETAEIDTDVMRQEIWEVAEALLQIKIPRENARKDEGKCQSNIQF